MTTAAGTLTPVFAALGDDTRWAILARLGVVESERRGRELVHRALGGRLSDVARELERIGRSWDARLARIKKLAEGG